MSLGECDFEGRENCTIQAQCFENLRHDQFAADFQWLKHIDAGGKKKKKTDDENGQEKKKHCVTGGFQKKTRPGLGEKTLVLVKSR